MNNLFKNRLSAIAAKNQLRLNIESSGQKFNFKDLANFNVFKNNLLQEMRNFTFDYLMTKNDYKRAAIIKNKLNYIDDVIKLVNKIMLQVKKENDLVFDKKFISMF